MHIVTVCDVYADSHHVLLFQLMAVIANGLASLYAPGNATEELKFVHARVVTHFPNMVARIAKAWDLVVNHGIATLTRVQVTPRKKGE